MIRSSLLRAALLVAVPACGNVPSSGDAGPAGPDAAPGSPDAGTDASPVTCEPSTTVCDDARGELTVCDAAGQGSVQRCALGCQDGEERCTDVAPSNGLGAYLDMTTSGPSIDIPDGSVIETAAGTIVSSAGPISVPSFVVEQVGAPSIRVFVVAAATIGDVTINGASAFAMVADGPIVIEGRLSVGARGTIPGAGARTCTVRDGRGGDGVHAGNTGYVFPGGGGGALVGDPGRGGDVALSSGGPFQGGAAGLRVDATRLAPLRGGCAGGGTDYPDQTGIVQVGSGGGGAVQLVSRTQVSLLASARGVGVIDVGGGGGQPGPNNSTGSSGGGGGGGAGGGVLIEAPAVLMSGDGVVIAAKGGGGGGGCTGAGADGGTAAMPARGGDCGGSTALTGGGDGGVVVYGGAVTAARPGVSSTALSGNRASGGGGGSHGVVRINTATGELALGAGAAIYASTTIGELGRR